MAWRPYSNLIEAELDNRTAGKVTGWIRFFRNGKRPLRATFDLTGDFHDDIRGKVIRLRNPEPSDVYHDEGKTYMDGFSRVQRGEVGDITAGIPLGPWTEEIAGRLMMQNEVAWENFGLNRDERDRKRREYADRYRAHIEAGDFYYPYVNYPYIEWYSDNGRVVLELQPTQLEIIGGGPGKEKTPEEQVDAERKRTEAFGKFLRGMIMDVSEANRKQGGDGDVTGIVIG